MASPLHVAVRSFAVAALLSSFTACSDTDGSNESQTEEPFPAFNGDCSTVKAVPTFAKLEQGLLVTCRSCHSAQVTGAARRNAPPGIDFDTYEIFSAFADSAVLLVQNRLMPPPAGEGVTESQRNQLFAWAACGKPR
jgi:uncharacterized membrane protein